MCATIYYLKYLIKNSVCVCVTWKETAIYNPYRRIKADDIRWLLKGLLGGLSWQRYQRGYYKYIKNMFRELKEPCLKN